jgi:hypothetical protein
MKAYWGSGGIVSVLMSVSDLQADYWWNGKICS